MAGALVLMIILGGFALFRFAIGKLWFEATREKLEDEKKKNEYLKSKYKHIEKEPRVKAILVLVPKKKSGNWTVEKMVKKGVFPRETLEHEFVTEISDRELSKIIHDERKEIQKKENPVSSSKAGNKPRAYYSVDEVTTIIQPRISKKGIVTFYDLAGNRVPGIPKTPKEKALQWKCFLGKKTFKKVQRWVPVNASHVEPHLKNLEFINAHSIKPIKELKPFKRTSNSELTMKVPSPGESISEVEISAWYVTTGDYVEKDQAIAEFDTEKATLELPAEAAGRITILVKEGRTIKVGAACCVIDTSANAPNTKTDPRYKTQKYVPMELAFDFDIDCSNLTRKEFSENYKSKYGTLTGYGRFKSPTALYIGHYNKGELNGYAEAHQDNGRIFKGEFTGGQLTKGEIHTPASKKDFGMIEIGQFIDFELHGHGSRELLKGNTKIVWRGQWKNGEITSGECLTEATKADGALFSRRIGEWTEYELHGEGKEIVRLTQGNEMDESESEGTYENDLLVRGRIKTASYEIDSSTKTKKLIALVEVSSTFTNISAINRKGKYSKVKYAPEPSGEFNLKLMGGHWPHDANIKGEIRDGIVTKISGFKGAASVYVDDQQLVNLSWYDLINDPPLPPKVSKEEMTEELEGQVVVMMNHFPDGSYSHSESGQMKNGKFIPDEESLRRRIEQFGSEDLP